MQVNRTVKGLVVAMVLVVVLVGGVGFYKHAQLVEATENVNRLEQKVEAKDIKVNKLSDSYKDLGNEVEKLEEENKVLKEEKESANIENKELTKEVKELEEEVSVMKVSASVKKQEKKQDGDEEVTTSKEAESSIEDKVESEVKTAEVQPVSKKTLQLEATMYTAFCDTGCIGVTATGVDVSNTIYYNGLRVVAVDPNVIPLNTVMEIEYANGTKEKVIAVDTGGAIKGHKIDILVDSKEKALNFGRQSVTVRVLDWG